MHRALAVREILVATDFSGPSNKSFEAALALAEHFSARLHVLHVAADTSERDEAEAKLESIMPKPIEGLEVLRAVRIGHAAPEIVRYAEREQIDLIVLGTHGRSGLTRVLMGSVAEAVVRAASCQVLTIGPKAKPAEEAVETVAPVAAASETFESQCLICAKPSQKTICDLCKAYIQGEAIERKRREEQPGHRGISI
jgi:nucleotide-binding universal stress UspA family protein